MYHNNVINTSFTSSIAGKLYDIELHHNAIKVADMHTSVSAGDHVFVVADASLTDGGDYQIKIVNVANIADFKLSKKFVIQKALRVGFKVGSKL